jgi:hypothetical protein
VTLCHIASVDGKNVIVTVSAIGFCLNLFSSAEEEGSAPPSTRAGRPGSEQKQKDAAKELQEPGKGLQRVGNVLIPVANRSRHLRQVAEDATEVGAVVVVK